VKDGQFRLNDFIAYKLANLSEKVSDSCGVSYMQDFGITVPEWRILSRLAEHQSLRAKDLGEITFMDKSRVSRALKSLQQKQYITRVVNAQDQRASYTALSEAGRGVYCQIVVKALDWEQNFLSVLSEEEEALFFQVLPKLEKRLLELSE
jgi:DNA-binding MarR family transcriptional regulator